ncbi:MAG: TOBE domain-containing protein, partial [Anaerolineales bacterium]
EFVTKEKGEIKEKEFVEVLLRPEGATVISNEATEATAIRDTQYAIRSNSIEGKILEKSFHGSRTTLKVLAGGRTLTFEFPATPPLPAAGETVRLRVAPDAIHFIA